MPTFKCSRCGHRSHTFASMSKHARTHKFPRGRKSGLRVGPVEQTATAGHYCPVCGRYH